MTTYSSKPTEVAMPVSSVYERVSNPAAFQERLDALPEEVRAKLGAVRFTEDSIIITAAPMGDMVLKITERVADKRVAFTAESAPVPLIMSINLDAKTPESPYGRPETARSCRQVRRHGKESCTFITKSAPLMIKPVWPHQTG